MQWIFENHKVYNIGVVCMSFGADTLEKLDPLSKGAEALWKIGLTVAIIGIIGAIIGANIANNIEVSLLKKLFGGFLLLIAFYEIYSLIKKYKKKKKTNNK